MIFSFENTNVSKKYNYLLRKYETLYQTYNFLQESIQTTMSLDPVSGQKPFAPKPRGPLGPERVRERSMFRFLKLVFCEVIFLQCFVGSLLNCSLLRLEAPPGLDCISSFCFPYVFVSPLKLTLHGSWIPFGFHSARFS